MPCPSPMHGSEKWKWSQSVESDPQRPHGLQPTRLFHPWDFPGKSTGVGCHCLLPWMWELDYKESWAPRIDLWTVVLEKTLESSLGCKEIQPVHPKGDQSWILNGRTDAEAETLIFWPPDVKSWLIWKDPDAEKDWKAGGEGDDRGWDGWMAPPTRWTWVWVSSGSWWWTGRPGVLQSMGSQRVGHNWATELNWNSHKSKC